MRPLAVFAGIVMLAGPASPAVMAAPPARSSPAAAPKPAATPKPKPPKPHTVSGTLESYDASARTLTVKGSKATWTFNVADARVWDGSKSVGLEDIVSRTGAKVTVKYVESEGLKSAVSVRLAATHGGKSGSKSQ
jgi:phage baseplate assembly protein gpV